MADDKKSGPNEEELDKLEEEIEHARRDGEEAEHGSFYEGESPMFGDETDEEKSDADKRAP